MDAQNNPSWLVSPTWVTQDRMDYKNNQVIHPGWGSPYIILAPLAKLESTYTRYVNWLIVKSSWAPLCKLSRALLKWFESDSKAGFTKMV